MGSVVVRVPVYWTAGTQAARDKEVPHPSQPTSVGTSLCKEHPRRHLDGRAQGAASARASSLFTEKSPRQGSSTSGKESAARSGRGGSLRLAQWPPAPGRPSDRRPRDWPGKTRHPLRTTGLPSPDDRTQRGAWTRGPMTTAGLRPPEQMAGRIQLRPCWPRPRSGHRLWSPGCWLSPARPSVLGTRTGRGLTSALPAATASAHKPPCAHALTLMCL